jgi:D-alanyl-D-alanine carboxypeptidase
MNFILLLVLSLNILNPFIIDYGNFLDIPYKIESVSLGIQVTAKSALVVDKDTDKILFSKNKNEILPIASITKLMSVYVLLNQGIDWDQIVEVKKEDKRLGGRIYLGPGEKVTNEDLINLSLVSSDNQSIMTLVRGNGFTEDDFVNRMNIVSDKLGMVNTEFYDPTGLDKKNVSTVHDLAKLARVIFLDDRIIEILSKKEYVFKESANGIYHRSLSTDKLLKSFLKDNEDYFLIAGKTGYLPVAGYCFLSESSDKDGNKIITVVLGSKSDFYRFQDTKGLIVWSFDNWSWD